MSGLRVMAFWGNFTPAEEILGDPSPQRVQPAKTNLFGKF